MRNPTPVDDFAAARSDLAPTGTLRAAIDFGNPVLAQKDPDTSEPRGVSVVLATELARRLGVPHSFTAFEAAGKAFAALKAGTVDVAFLALEPERAADVAFTAPYVVIEAPIWCAPRPRCIGSTSSTNPAFASQPV